MNFIPVKSARITFAASAAAVLFFLAPARAELHNPELVCGPDTAELTPHQVVRALSFDLRGKPPSMEELASVTAVGGIPENMVDEWLQSPEFADQMVRLHRALFWNELSNLRFMNDRMRLQSNSGIWWRRQNAQTLRGGNVPIQCLDEPAQWDSDGELVTEASTDEFGNPVRREGWVEVAPYWAPDTMIKVCGMDAEAAETGKDGTDCSTSDATSDVGCGCGPDLRWCWTNAIRGDVAEALEGDMDRRVRWLLTNDRPYSELLTDAPAFVNGAVVHFLTHLVPFGGSIGFRPRAIPVVQLPDVSFTDTTWTEVPLSSAHSGVLSSPAYLLRFQTNRARASKFSTDFLCDPYVAPSGGLPPTTDEEAMEPDLQKRPGCKYCHARLEPTASYWGRFPESGAGMLDKQSYPAFSPACEACALKTAPCDTDCSRYVTSASTPSEKAWFGWLKTMVFRKQAHIPFIDEGPAALVKRSLVDSKLPRCVTRKAAAWLFGRGLHAEESAWLDEVAQEFLVGGLRLRELISALVRSDMYRMAR